MKNLAGDERADKIVQDELFRCGIETVAAELNGEVPAKHMGRLSVVRRWRHGETEHVTTDDYSFRRAWYYWVVEGFVPLEIARKLYEHPVGRVDVRVAGHCGCPPPEEHVTHFAANGKEIAKAAERIKAEDGASGTGSWAIISREILATYEFSDDPAKAAARSGVTSYHIDSELGLYLFVRAVKGLGT